VLATVFHRRELFSSDDFGKFVALEQRDQHAECVRYPARKQALRESKDRMRQVRLFQGGDFVRRKLDRERSDRVVEMMRF
jgi:hypothetical protein